MFSVYHKLKWGRKGLRKAFKIFFLLIMSRRKLTPPFLGRSMRDWQEVDMSVILVQLLLQGEYWSREKVLPLDISQTFLLLILWAWPLPCTQPGYSYLFLEKRSANYQDSPILIFMRLLPQCYLCSSVSPPGILQVSSVAFAPRMLWSRPGECIH